MNIIIDEEFKQICPKLSLEEFQGLQTSILTEGCRDPLVLWGEILIDGHNRYEICQANHIEFKTTTMDFPSRDAAKEWIVRNQFSRRNLNSFQRVELALQLEGVFAAKGKANQGKRTDLCQKSDKSPKPVDTKREIASLAGVSHDTVAKVKKILAYANEDIQNRVRQGEISINAAYTGLIDMDGLRRSMDSTAKDFSEIAKHLIKVKDLLSPDQWEAWLKAEFGWSVKYADRIIEAEKASVKTESLRGELRNVAARFAAVDGIEDLKDKVREMAEIVSISGRIQNESCENSLRLQRALGGMIEDYEEAKRNLSPEAKKLLYRMIKEGMFQEPELLEEEVSGPASTNQFDFDPEGVCE